MLRKIAENPPEPPEEDPDLGNIERGLPDPHKDNLPDPHKEPLPNDQEDDLPDPYGISDTQV